MGPEEKLPADCFEALEIEGLPGGVYRSQMPNSLYGGDEGDLLIPHWKAAGISHVVCLQQRDEMEYFTAMILPEECYPDEGLSCTWHPIPDHHGSNHSEKLLEDAKSVNEILDAGAKVVIHCHAGIGRTGTFIAAMLMARGASAGVARKRVRDSSQRLRWAINKDQQACLEEL